jgi:4-hydroxy-3-methylbut-2-enyl diphosphate reductase
MEEFEKKGVIILDIKGKTRLELLDLIKTDGTVIFSAHGVSPSVYSKAKSMGLDIVDATCPYVNVVHNKIIDYIKKGYSIIYIGGKGHPECEGVLGIDDNISLVTSKDDVINLNINNELIYVTNQTTLSIYDIKDIFNEILNKYPNAVIDDKICMATTIRQKAIMEQDIPDLCIIVGDPSSSNTKKLKQVSLLKGINTIMIESIKDLSNISFDNIKTISISSGASTPSYLVDEIINYIKNIK